mgnify:FL=1
MKHRKTNLLLGMVAAGYLSIVLANIGLNRMIEGNGNPEQGKGMVWGVKMAEAILDTPTAADSAYLTLEAYAVDVSNKYSSEFYLQNGTVLRNFFGTGSIWGRGGYLGRTAEFDLLPERLTFTYLSQFENKFYQLDEALLTDKIRPMMAKSYRVFNNAVEDTETPRYESPNNFELAVAPGGWVTLNLTSTFIHKELMSWQAREIVPSLEEAAKHHFNEMWYYDVEFYHDPKRRAEYLDRVRKEHPDFYHTYIAGSKKVSAEWYKQMQTKYPWNLEVEVDGGEWNGEYYMEFANTERWTAIGKERIEEEKKAMKAIPTYIRIWLIDKETGNRWGIRLHPFKTEEQEQNDYKIIYDDIRLNRLYRTFQQAFPGRTRVQNISTPSINQFATLKLKFDDHFELTEAYLQKDGQQFVLPDARIHQRYKISKTAYY